MRKVSNILNVVFSSVIQKSLPILIGIIVMNFYGEEGFIKFSLFLTGLIAFVVFISTGMVPALIKAITLSESDKQVVFNNYLSMACLAWLLISLVSISFSLCNLLPDRISELIPYLIVVSICVICILFSLAALQALGYTALAFRISVFNTLIVSFFVLISLMFQFEIFLIMYLISYVIMLFVSLWFLSKFEIFDIRLISISKATRSLLPTLKESGSVFIPNIIWMLGVFFFHSFVASTESTESEYSTFAIGYQWLTFIVFIPGALAPIVISYFSKAGGVRQVYCMSFLYIILGFIVTACFYFLDTQISTVYNIELTDRDVEILGLTLLSGCVAAGNAPLIQFLISKNHAIYITFASLSWLIIILISSFSTLFLNVLFESFFIAYLFSYFVLFFVVFLLDRKHVEITK